MPTALRIGPYRFFFYSSDRREAPHVHVERDAKIAKLWLRPVRVAVSGGFGWTEVGRLQALVKRHERELLRAWDAFFAG
jgi:hypothetical protein